MFKNRAIQVQMVKKEDKTATDTDVVPSVDPEQIAKIVQDTATTIIVTVGLVVAANRILNTACKIAVITTKARLR